MPIEDLKVKPEILSPKPPSIASDEEFAAGTSTTASPTVKQAKENLVTIDTYQTITGQKAFTTQLLRNSTDIDATLEATSNTYNSGIRFFDKNRKDIGALNNAQMNGGNIRTMLEARNKDNYVQTIGVQVPYEGSTGGFGYAPNTPADAPANAIVTKGYANAELNAKANTNASNFSQVGRETIVGWGMPDYSAAITATEPYTVTNKFTAPEDGILIYGYWSTAVANKIYVNDIVVGGFQGSENGYGLCYPLVLPLSKGDTFYQENANNATFPNQNNRFVPFKKVN